MFLLPVYYRNKKIGWGIVALLTTVSFVMTGFVVHKHHLAPVELNTQARNDYFLYAYSQPWHRIPTYFVGICTGWILVELESKGVSPQTGIWKPMGAAMMYVFGWGLLTFLVFITATNQGLHEFAWNDTLNIMYFIFARPLWGLGWAVVTLLCYGGHCPYTDAFLSHKFWTPFMRLTYGAYLCHPLVIKLAGACAVQYYTFSGMDLLTRMSGNVILAYSAAFVVWCLVERPVTTFTTTLIKSKKKKEPKRDGGVQGPSKAEPVAEEARPTVGK